MLCIALVVFVGVIFVVLLLSSKPWLQPWVRPSGVARETQLSKVH